MHVPRSTAEELAFIVEAAQATGVVLDPVYSGKAAMGMVQDLAKTQSGAATTQRPRRVLFIHTGGLLGIYEKAAQLAPLLEHGGGPLASEGAAA